MLKNTLLFEIRNIILLELGIINPLPIKENFKPDKYL